MVHRTIREIVDCKQLIAFLNQLNDELIHDILSTVKLDKRTVSIGSDNGVLIVSPRHLMKIFPKSHWHINNP